MERSEYYYAYEKKTYFENIKVVKCYVIKMNDFYLDYGKVFFFFF